MAITISSRKRTTIGYRGTPGGSLSWINQAGQSGKQLAATGRQMINMADDVKSFFDDEVSQAEIRQQVDDMQVAYLKQSRSWHKDLKEGGFQLDENGVPSKELNPNFYTDISNQHHEKFWQDYVTDKKYDSKAVSAFGVYFQNKAQESFNKADKWGTERRYSKLKAKDVTNVKAHMLTITNDPSVENKNSAFDALSNMHLSGAPHRDPGEWKGIIGNAQTELRQGIAITNAYGQKGRNLDPSDLINGYTVQEYSTAIERINADSTLTKDEKKAIVKGMTSNRKTRIAVEKTARATASNIENSKIFTMLVENKLTGDYLKNNTLISPEDKTGWMAKLAGGTKKPWKGDYNTIKDTILSGTWSDDNDIARTPEDVKQAVRAAANEKGIPADEVEKLMKDVDEIAKASPITVKKKAARTHAKEIFKAKLSTFERLMLGQANAGVMAQEAKAASDNKLWKFDKLLEEELKEGRQNGLTWNKMLSPNSPDYIVNDIIDTINETEPEAIKEEKPVEEEGVVSSISNFFFGEDDVEGVEHEIYGNKSMYKKGVTAQHAKAQVDSFYAQENYGDSKQRIIYPADHKGYSQYPEGKETIKAYKERMKLMGFVK